MARLRKAEAFRQDFQRLLVAAIKAGLTSPEKSVVVMSLQQAVELSRMRNRLGDREFGGISSKGGDLFGFKVVTSTDCPPSMLVLMDRDKYMPWP
jgi:hypothetical protein